MPPKYKLSFSEGASKGFGLYFLRLVSLHWQHFYSIIVKRKCTSVERMTYCIGKVRAFAAASCVADSRLMKCYFFVSDKEEIQFSIVSLSKHFDMFCTGCFKVFHHLL
jgi:hypothetical protein